MEGQSTPLLPTYVGHVSNTFDALILFEGCLSGELAHVPRRPHDRERTSLVQSGNVFIYEEHASGIKRWTDGIGWSPSRILGNFLIYRELDQPFTPGEKKRAIKRPKKSPQGITKSEHPPQINMGYLNSGFDASGSLKDQERALIGSLVDSYPFKPNGLVKKTISITYRGVPHHLVSYYSVHDVVSGLLKTPSEDPPLTHVVPRPELLGMHNLRQPFNDTENRIKNHRLAMASSYNAGHGQFSQHEADIIHRVSHHGDLQNVMNTTHQSHSSSPFPFPQHVNGAHSGFTSVIQDPHFHTAMHHQVPYTANPASNYALDPSRTDRFASAAVANQDFPRNMPSAASSRRESLYDVTVHQTGMGSISFGSNDVEDHSAANEAYLSQSTYYTSQAPTVSSTQHSTFPDSRGLKSESDSMQTGESIHQCYEGADTSANWGFPAIDGNPDQQYFTGQAPNQANAHWPNTLPRT
ncbi:hypothetical protein NQ176_g117 [Zarea fungicola]|uniref:Uncharacterized protein n=1 Tax=Zarea fungicola TaxID=93591 RepID=A0ACC1P0M6_9HYPO|nr:hypothetical protein NQ176_g117 [Lecanicillium fungicola]